jgi:ferritin-like metal-binding protein YciE
MQNNRDTLIAWLKDAHAMETGLIPVLENHAKDARNNPDAASRITQHMEETRRHAGMVEGCLKQLGADTSGTKTIVGRITGWIHSISSGASSDEGVKNCLMDYAAEHFEIASYRAIIEAANECGEPEIVRVCEQILRDEVAMAQWLEDQEPVMVREYLAKEAARERV